MATIHLKHPKHGTKIATMELEADADERNGWTRYDPHAPVVDRQVNELETRRRRRQPDTQPEEEK